MPTEIYLVKVGMTMTEGMVSEWYIPDGHRVEKGELLYALETEKVNLDVDAEKSGVVKHLVDAGITREPGDVVGYIFESGEQIPDNIETLSLTPAQARRVHADAERVGAGNEQSSAPPLSSREPVKASPLARRMAAERNLDLSMVKGTGPRGRITKEDVEGFQPPAVSLPASSSTSPDRAASLASVKPGEERLIPVTAMRRIIAQRMHTSLQNSAQLTMDMEIGMDDAVGVREQLVQEWQAEGIRPTYTDLVVRAVAKALVKHPLMNSQFRETEIALMSEINIGIAVALPQGLVVPVIRNADGLSLKALAVESARLAGAAKAGKLGLDDYAGGTFTVSALGMYGVDSFTPILNQPQAGILGVNRIYEGVTWQEDQAVKAQRMNLSLTWDHRVIDGAPAAEYLADVRELLEEPYRLLV